AVGRGILVELVDEHHHIVDTEVAALQVFPKPGYHPGEDQILGQRIDTGHVDHRHRTVAELAPRQVIGDTVVGHQPLGAGRNVAQSVAHLANRGDVMSAPYLCTAL